MIDTLIITAVYLAAIVLFAVAAYTWWKIVYWLVTDPE
jgi:hypothetical protein